MSVFYPEYEQKALQPYLCNEIYPTVPQSIEELGVPLILLEDLTFKIILNKGSLTGREIAQDLCLPFKIVEPILQDLKKRLLVGFRSTAGLGDFVYILSDEGRQKAFMSRDVTAYAASVPVPFEEYIEAVRAQSISNETIHQEDMEQAFSDLILDHRVFETLGPAINSSRGLFLYGNAGNGKTAIAERISRCFKEYIYIPKSLWVDGQIVQMYDPQCHEAVEYDPSTYDQRWILVKRPVVITGGELVMSSLEITYNELLKVCEAPLQLKANCGVFLIDDFGRQRVSHVDLLNRWIVPLEKRVDYLILPNGKKMEVPFDELIIFSTNLDPRELVDEAFLRRIPYKINIEDPTEVQFKAIFTVMASALGVPFDEAQYQYLLQKHYIGKRPFRACQPRDLLQQIVNTSMYANIPAQMTVETIDNACRSYFTVMGV